MGALAVDAQPAANGAGDLPQPHVVLDLPGLIEEVNQDAIARLPVLLERPVAALALEGLLVLQERVLALRIVHVLLVYQRVVEAVDVAGLGQARPVARRAWSDDRPQFAVDVALGQKARTTGPWVAQDAVLPERLDLVRRALLVEVVLEEMPAGNHAQAMAWASTASGIQCTVVMPENASKTKIRATEEYGAEVVQPGDVFAAFEKTLQIEKEEGKTLVHPFEDKFIISGHGTVGLEVLEQLDGIDVVVVGIGGGALSSGIAIAIKEQNPKIKVYGVEPEGANAMQAPVNQYILKRWRALQTV